MPYPPLENQRLVLQHVAQFNLHVLRRAGPLPLQVKCLDMGVEACLGLLVKVCLHLRDVLVEEIVYRVRSCLSKGFVTSSDFLRVAFRGLTRSPRYTRSRALHAFLRVSCTSKLALQPRIGGSRDGSGTLSRAACRRTSANAVNMGFTSALGAMPSAGSWAAITLVIVAHSCGAHTSSRRSKHTPSVLTLPRELRRLGGDRPRRWIGDTTKWYSDVFARCTAMLRIRGLSN